MQKVLHTWAEGQQWENRGNTVHGSWGGYLVSLRDLGRTTLVLTVALPPISQDVQAKLVGFIARNRRSLKIADHTYNSQVQTIVVKQQVFSLKPIDITTVLTAITDEMNALDIPGQDHCGICGSTGELELIYINDTLVATCDECLGKAYQDAEDLNRERAQEELNYTRGTVGAVLGALIGAVPWVVVSLLGWTASYLGYLIGRAALKGYQLLGGKVGSATRWIIGGTTVAVAILANLAAIGVELVRVDVPVTPIVYAVLFTDPEIAGSLWKDMLIGVVMAVLGISSLFSGLKSVAESRTISITKASPRIVGRQGSSQNAS